MSVFSSADSEKKFLIFQMFVYFSNSCLLAAFSHSSLFVPEKEFFIFL